MTPTTPCARSRRHVNIPLVVPASLSGKRSSRYRNGCDGTSLDPSLCSVLVRRCWYDGARGGLLALTRVSCNRNHRVWFWLENLRATRSETVSPAINKKFVYSGIWTSRVCGWRGRNRRRRAAASLASLCPLAGVSAAGGSERALQHAGPDAATVPRRGLEGVCGCLALARFYRSPLHDWH